MMPLRLFIIGNSHLHAISAAYRSLVAHGKSLPVQAEFVRLFQRDFAPRLEPGFFRRDVLNRRTVKAIRRADGGIVVSCVGGNAYNILGLVKHPRPFDFVLTQQPGLPVADGAEILPSAAIRPALMEKMQLQLTLLRAVRRHVRGRMLHLESPPPIPSAEHIRDHPKAFREKLAELGVAPASLRYKLWRLQSFLVHEECRKLDIEFVPAPPETRDAEGMLVAHGWARDPTHGNRWYGRCVLRDLTRRLQTSDAAASIRA